MSLRKISPAANLLRTSRLFSIPHSLPKPTPDSTATVHTSDTATLPYPIHAAIETSESALGRGDWGLKRPLPLKSTTRTSTPHIFIENIDSIDHITDFGSAADHTRTLEKWHETNLSISRSSQNNRKGLQSVFESAYDNTAPSPRARNQERWRFKGPWLSGQNRGQFSEYLARRIRNRRSEFRQYLKNVFVYEKRTRLRRESIENGHNGVQNVTQNDVVGAVSDKELDDYIKHLRRITNGLNRHIQIFLDLPRDLQSQMAAMVHEDNQEIVPPSTHPSAGLSYLRSHSHTFNHPVYGPQSDKPPVRARVLLPQKDARGFLRPHAVLGVGGVTAQDHKASFTKSGEEEAIAGFDPDIPGGGKVWLQLRKASISPRGRIELGTQRAEDNALSAAGATRGIELPEAAARSAHTTSMPDLTPRPSQNRKVQGYGLEDFGDVRRSERAVPFADGTDLPDVMKKALQGDL